MNIFTAATTTICRVWGILHQVFSTPGEFYTKKSGYFYTREFYTIFSFFVRKILLFLVQNSPGVEFSWCKNTHFLENSTPGDFYTKTKSGISTPFLFLFLRKESTFFGVEFSWCRNNLVQKTPFFRDQETSTPNFSPIFFHQTSNNQT